MKEGQRNQSDVDASEEVEEDTSPSVLRSSNPESPMKNALKEALDMAQSVGDRQKNKGNLGGFGLANFDDSVSLYEYIDEAEKKSKTLFDSPSFGEQRPVEDLDGLNIAAEFGRPDESTDDTEDDFSEISIMPQANEDTKDLKLPSIPPKAALDQQPAQPAMEESSDVRTGSASAEYNFDGLEIRGKKLRSGKLENERMWEVLLAASDIKFRGLCILDIDGETRSFLINEGDVLAAATTNVKNDLLSLMVREKCLTEESMTAVRREMTSAEGAKFRNILLKKGWMRLPNINRMERLHHEILLKEAMGWSFGNWRIEPISTIREMPDAPIETPLLTLVVQGVEMSPDCDEALRRLSSDTVPVPVTTALRPLSEPSLDEMQSALVQEWDGRRSLGESFARVDGPEDAKLRFAATMILLGFFEAKKGAQKSAAHSQREPVLETPNDETPARDAATPSPRAMEAQLSLKLEKVDNGTYFEILEIDPSAGDAEIEAARERLMEIFDVQRYWDAGISGAESEVDLVRQIVEEAYEVLREPARRERYRKAAMDGLQKQ